MIDTGQIRAAAAAVEGDIVGITKAQLDELLNEVDVGQHARRTLQSKATFAPAGIDRVSQPDRG